MIHTWGRREIHIEFWLGNLKERDYLDDLEVDGNVILKLILKKEYGRKSTGFMWLRIVVSSGLL
jgi:hypothetical protein